MERLSVERHAHAKRIAVQVLRETYDGALAVSGHRLDADTVQTLMARAALQALTEKESH